MAIILGISGGFSWGTADAAATLMVDGVIIAACEEERFTRIKQSAHRIPIQAMRFVLSELNLTLDAVDTLACNNETYEHFREDLKRVLQHEFGCLPKSIMQVNHHFAHAASAYYASGFEHAAILTYDFSGDGICTGLYEGKSGNIRTIDMIPTASGQSLGKYYAAFTQALGYVFGDEYKIMGLSAFGTHDDIYDLDRLIKIDKDSFQISQDFYHDDAISSLAQPLFNRALFEEMGLPVRVPGTTITEEHKRLARSAQRYFEAAALTLAQQLKKLTGAANLVMAGGCSLNCAFNGVLHRTGWFNRLYVPPVASDAGGSLGAAYVGAMDAGDKPRPMRTALLGSSYDAQTCANWLSRLKISGKEVDDVAAHAAADIGAGKLVGWFQGRGEFGPRALGARSILANPRDPTTKDKINTFVKFRESFRPFAPSVLAESAAQYFDIPEDSPYMTVVYPVRHNADLPAITHIDGTARVQTVDSDPNSAHYRELLHCMEREIGAPVVLNTSFNINGQPIVNTPHEAIYTFFSTGLDVLYLGPFRVEKGC